MMSTRLYYLVILLLLALIASHLLGCATGVKRTSVTVPNVIKPVAPMIGLYDRDIKRIGVDGVTEAEFVLGVTYRTMDGGIATEQKSAEGNQVHALLNIVAIGTISEKREGSSLVQCIAWSKGAFQGEKTLVWFEDRLFRVQEIIWKGESRIYYREELTGDAIRIIRGLASKSE